MDRSLRILLIVGAAATLLLICSAVKRQKIQIEDSLFWICFSGLLVVLAVFPQIAFWLSGLLGFQSPANFVYVTIIALMLVREFRNSSKISTLKYRVDQLAQEVALDENDRGAAKDEGR